MIEIRREFKTSAKIHLNTLFQGKYLSAVVLFKQGKPKAMYKEFVTKKHQYSRD